MAIWILKIKSLKNSTWGRDKGQDERKRLDGQEGEESPMPNVCSGPKYHEMSRTIGHTSKIEKQSTVADEGVPALL